jgi:energy-converting hydrogenase Eha subunit G
MKLVLSANKIGLQLSDTLLERSFMYIRKIIVPEYTNVYMCVFRIHNIWYIIFLILYLRCFQVCFDFLYYGNIQP